MSNRRSILCVLAVLLLGSPCFAQTFDAYGGKITNTDGTTAPTCGVTSYSVTGASISGNGTTATVTTTGNFTTILGPVGTEFPIFVTNASNTGFNVTAAPGVLATVTSTTTLTYANATNATATGATIAAASPWYQKINSHWWACTPLGHEAWQSGPTLMPSSVHGTTNLSGVIQRMDYMGFNTIGAYANANLFPTNASQTNKAPFTFQSKMARYSVSEIQTCGGLPLANPVKDLFLVKPAEYAASGAYTGYSGAADYYDANMGTWLADAVTCDGAWPSIKNSVYLSYLDGVFSDDSDDLFGIAGGGPDFATSPSGHNTSNLAFYILNSSPLEVVGHQPYQTTSGCQGGAGCDFVYAHTQSYSKLALRNALATEYGTIGALNTAWGSSYTTFDSSGTCVGSQPITCATSVAADSVGTGDGVTTTFTGTLSHHTGISAFSVQVLVAGTPKAGTYSAEGSATYTSWVGLSSGSVNPTTGAFSFTFAAAPANGAAITATYVDCGWGCGTGLLDEDDRTAHQTYLGHDFVFMVGAATAVKTDVNTFLQAIAGQYFSTFRNGIKAVYPSVPYLCSNTVGTWASPPSAQTLAAAGQYCDVIVSGGGAALYTSAEMTYIYNNYGDKPQLQGWYSSADPDSAIDASSSSSPNPAFDYATQPLRAQAYYNGANGALTTNTYPNGSFPVVGMYWWAWVDQPSQTLAGGLCTVTDNCYNAADAVSGTVTCVGVTTGFNTCGSEPAPGGTAGATRPYGDLLDGANGVIAANALWYATNYGATVPMLPPLNLGISVAKASGKSSGSSQGKK